MGWAGHIWWLGLASRHRFLLTFLIVDALYSLLDSFIVTVHGWGEPTVAPTHFQMWTTLQPIMWALMLLVVMEVLAHVAGADHLGPLAAIGSVLTGGLMMTVLFAFRQPEKLGNFWVRQELNINAAFAVLVVAIWLYSGSEAEWNSRVTLAVFSTLFASHVGIVAFRDVYGWEAGTAARYEVMPSVHFGLFLLGGACFSRGLRSRRALGRTPRWAAGP